MVPGTTDIWRKRLFGHRRVPSSQGNRSDLEPDHLSQYWHAAVEHARRTALQFALLAAQVFEFLMILLLGGIAVLHTPSGTNGPSVES